MFNEKLLNLSSCGRLIVVSDLHGNYEDYKKYLELWDSKDTNCHIVFIGDLIHSTGGDDKSVEIVDDAIVKCRKYPNFHVLLGNHEWAHITKTDIYKREKNQRLAFEEEIISKKGSLYPTLNEYVDFFKSLPFFIKTENGLFISHTGPSKKIKTMEDFNEVLTDDFDNEILYEFLWNRCIDGNDYDKQDVSDFLKIIGSDWMIIGHTPVKGYKIFGKQIILSSSFQTTDKAYFDIDLSEKIDDLIALLDTIKFLK